MKKTIKILSVFLATIMFFSVFSAANPVFAMELQNAEAQSVVSDADEATAETAEEAKEEIQLYLEKLYEFDPKTVGGALPNDDFYYLEK